MTPDKMVRIGTRLVAGSMLMVAVAVVLIVAWSILMRLNP